VDGNASLQMAMNVPLVSTLQQQQQQLLQASITIIEEPMPRVRFRYASEGGCAGNIYGIHSKGEHQTFPTILVSCTLFMDVMS